MPPRNVPVGCPGPGPKCFGPGLGRGAVMSMMLLHNPQCSKSRAAKALLEARGLDFSVRPYLQEPLSLDELRILKAKLGREPAEWIRWGEKVDVAAAGITRDDPPMQLLRAIAAHPRLMERPILVREDDAVVGRPTEAIEAFLGSG